MAQFIGYVDGMRGDVSRLGSKDSGLRASANGWNIGGKARIYHDNGTDRVCLDITSGSGYSGHNLGFGPFDSTETSTQHLAQALRNIEHSIESIAKGSDFTHYAPEMSDAQRRRLAIAARQISAAIANIEKAEPKR